MISRVALCNEQFSTRVQAGHQQMSGLWKIPGRLKPKLTMIRKSVADEFI